jgi:hypothetical protein
MDYGTGIYDGCVFHPLAEFNLIEEIEQSYNQYTLPFGKVEEVRQEVLDNLRILGEGGGYILAPCHNIQAISSPENIVAMYQTGYEFGWM